MTERAKEFRFYPSEEQLEGWLEEIWQAGQEIEFEVELLGEHGFGEQVGVRHIRGFQHVCFRPKGMHPFYGYWQPAHSSPAPLIVHTPGYGAEMSVHPDVVMSGFNVLHINPLGYVAPSGADESRRRNDNWPWPVFEDTVANGGKKGYCEWFSQCALAVRWAHSLEQVLPDRVSFFGTSQGGGASLLMGSLYRDRGVRCVAADVPWMINFPMARAFEQ